MGWGGGAFIKKKGGGKKRGLTGKLQPLLQQVGHLGEPLVVRRQHLDERHRVPTGVHVPARTSQAGQNEVARARRVGRQRELRPTDVHGRRWEVGERGRDGTGAAGPYPWILSWTSFAMIESGCISDSANYAGEPGARAMVMEDSQGEGERQQRSEQCPDNTVTPISQQSYGCREQGSHCAMVCMAHGARTVGCMGTGRGVEPHFTYTRGTELPYHFLAARIRHGRHPLLGARKPPRALPPSLPPLPRHGLRTPGPCERAGAGAGAK